MPRNHSRRTICYVTGTRAEFGLMQSTLCAIQSHPKLRLQLIVTGMHLDAAHGKTINEIKRDGWAIDAIVTWKPAGENLSALAQQTGQATAHLAAAYAKLNPDIVLVVGDRVEAFAAATAAHLSGRILAHVHGGDRALGQVDDSLRHAITKLAHIHFPATRQSARRIEKLGEDEWRIHPVGSPGIDGIVKNAWPLDQCSAYLKQTTALGMSSDPSPLRSHPYVILLYHPTDPIDDAEYARAQQLLEALRLRLGATVRRLIVYPNNDPGSAGIVQYWDELQHRQYRATPEQLSRTVFVRNLPREAFLGLLRDAAVLVGNSSSGIIEAASFGTPVLDIGPRQSGRERGPNVTTVPFKQSSIRHALKQIWNNAQPRRHSAKNLYGAGDTAHQIAHHLTSAPLNDLLRRKLIAY